MNQTQRELLKVLLASGGVRADDKQLASLESLVSEGLCYLEEPQGNRRPQPTYRLTEKGKLIAGSLVAPFFG
jgi:hypothetical protein